MHQLFRTTLGDPPRRDTEHHEVMLFQSHRDYLDTLHNRYGVNAVGTGGMYFHRPEGSALAVWVEERPHTQVQRVLQHEAFRQFARPRFGTDLPGWVEEGLAMYFSDVIIINDQPLAGEMRHSMLDAMQDAIERAQHVPFLDLLRMDNEAWQQELRRTDGFVLHHQAWSMVHFLLHGESGRHIASFQRYLRHLAGGVPNEHAFQRAFTTDDPEAFERAWRAHVITARPGEFLTALERIDFLAAGALELNRRGQRPMTLDTLKELLREITFSHTSSIRGMAITLLADDDHVFTIPSRRNTHHQPHFVLTEPERRILSRRELQLEQQNPRPASIQTRNLEPRNLNVRWLRNVETNTLRYEIEFK